MATLEIPYIIRIKVLYGGERYKCGKAGCKGWMNDDEFGFKLQREKCLKDVASKEVKEIDKLSWHQEFVGDLSPRRNKLLSKPLPLYLTSYLLLCVVVQDTPG